MNIISVLINVISTIFGKKSDILSKRRHYNHEHQKKSSQNVKTKIGEEIFQFF